MGVDRSLYLVQKRGETLVELDEESYERVLENPRSRVVKHRNNRPVIKIV